MKDAGPAATEARDDAVFKTGSPSANDPHFRSMKASLMRIFMFSSQAKGDLHAFAGDEAGSQLPGKFAPWALTGTLTARQTPPHKFSRQVIENSIVSDGFQLWRTKSKS